MSTVLNTNGTDVQVPVPSKAVAGNFYIITAEWNSKITHALRDAAIDTLQSAGVCHIREISVPGTVELVNAAALAIKRSTGHPGTFFEDATEAVIVLGCVIRGETPHFDYVCKIAADGVAALNARGEAPVVFGVLTVDDEQQALDRAGGVLGNKGAEAAAAAIAMANVHAEVRESTQHPYFDHIL